MENLAYIEYNVLANLRKFSSKLSIYDALILSKKMRYSLVKVQLDPKIYLAKLDNLSQAKEEAPIAMKETSRIIFQDKDLLLRTTIHNRPFYV